MVGIPTLVFYTWAVSVLCIQGKDDNEAKKPEKRIIGGVFAIPHEFPHHLLLLITSSGKSEICGGSLLTTDWVLTAAHCMFNMDTQALQDINSFTIIAAKHYGPQNQKQTDPNTQQRLAKELFVHPCFNFKELSGLNDVVLIKLDSPFTLNKNVTTIKVDEADRAKPCSEVTTIGWGVETMDPDIKIPIPDELKKATLHLPKEGDCEIFSPGIDVGSQICAKDMGGFTCFGDSGGGLLCKDGGVSYVCGTVSFGSKTCEKGPSVFVRVFYYRDWIKKVIESGSNININCATAHAAIPLKGIPPKECGGTTETVETTEGVQTAEHVETTESVKPTENANDQSSRLPTVLTHLLYGFYIGTILIS